MSLRVWFLWALLIALLGGLALLAARVTGGGDAELEADSWLPADDSGGSLFAEDPEAEQAADAGVALAPAQTGMPTATQRPSLGAGGAPAARFEERRRHRLVLRDRTQRAEASLAALRHRLELSDDQVATIQDKLTIGLGLLAAAQGVLSPAQQKDLERYEKQRVKMAQRRLATARLADLAPALGLSEEQSAQVLEALLALRQTGRQGDLEAEAGALYPILTEEQWPAYVAYTSIEERAATGGRRVALPR